jgi:hypothetical protein
MGRFDALTQLEEKQTAEPVDAPVAPSSPHSPAPAIQETHEQTPTALRGDMSSASAPTQPSAGMKQRASGKMPAPQQPGKSINALQPKQEKFEKFSTYLRPGYKKILKNIANDRDCKSYEILDEALTAFFEARKK